jgi:hypothetical protein
VVRVWLSFDHDGRAGDTLERAGWWLGGVGYLGIG